MIKLLKMLEGSHQRFLNHFLGILLIACKPEGQREERFSVGVHQLFKSSPVTL